MDRITKSLLSEFSQEHEIASLTEEKQFEHFGAFLTIGRHHQSAFDTSDVVTGAGGDTGIDAIGILANGSLLTDPEMVAELAETNGYLDVTFVFVQAERSSGFESQKIGQFGFGVEDFFAEKPKLQRNAAVASASEVMSAVYGFSSKFKRGNPSCRLYYVTTGRWVGDTNLEARRTSVVEDLQALGIFRDVEFQPIGADGVQRYYNQSKNAISREFSFQERVVVPDVPGVAEAYLGLIPATEFLTLIQDETGELLKTIFYDNVRDWQDYNVVNEGIRDTLASADARRRFALMNNGITVIAKTVRATGNRFNIEDYQIVNGCQTSHVLWYQRDELDESVVVPLRLIATDNEDVINSIIKATNRQTQVTEDQLLALSDFQKKLELYFKSFDSPVNRLYYERRSRQYASTSIEKTRIFTPPNLIRAYASIFLSEPHRTTRNFRSLLDRVGKSIFVEDHRLEPYYTAAFAYYRLEYLFRNQSLEPNYKPARFHILFSFRILANSTSPPRANSHEMERYCEALNGCLWDAEKAEALFRRSAKLVDQVAEGNFHRDHIRTQPFTEKLEKASLESDASN